ncbi:unnamed protein product [Peronospora destructor]|uniref:Uncharacterized protein n=1 Tax=Peronospora destructor TaxID=86335 RepID=A0AAV0UY41_9STRA|nr:unnamed protein product [Peronospora destructor]
MMDLLDEVVAEKIENLGQPPLLLHFWGRHYSALLHTGRTSQLPDFEEEVECKFPVLAENLPNAPAATHANASMQQLALRTAPVDAPLKGPWDPDSWNGTTDEVWAALQGCSVHPDLQHDLHVLFMIDKPKRSRDLSKLVATAAMTIDLLAQQQFAAILRGEKGEEAELALTQRMQITQETLSLWQCQLQAAGHIGPNLDRHFCPPARETAGLLTMTTVQMIRKKKPQLRGGMSSSGTAPTYRWSSIQFNGRARGLTCTPNHASGGSTRNFRYCTKKEVI